MSHRVDQVMFEEGVMPSMFNVSRFRDGVATRTRELDGLGWVINGVVAERSQGRLDQ